MQKVKIIQGWCLAANAPVFSAGPPYACQPSQTFDPLQVRDPWQSWHSGPGSQRDVNQALWAEYGLTATAVRSLNPMSQPYRDFRSFWRWDECRSITRWW